MKYKHSTLPPIRTDIGEAKQDLDERGITRFSGAFTDGEIAEALNRLKEQAAGEDEHGIGYHDHGDTGHNDGGANQRIWNLVNKGEIFRRMVTNWAMLELARHMLGEKILLSSWTANIAKKGGNAQQFHSDQWWAPEINHTVMADCFIMLNDFTAENGATRVVPGSHLSGEIVPLQPPLAVPATGPAGTILAMDARTWHGAGANQTDSPRYGLLPRYCKPYIRQQENMTMSMASEVLEKCSPELKALAGFMVWHTFGMMGDDAETELHKGRPTCFLTELKPAECGTAVRIR